MENQTVMIAQATPACLDEILKILSSVDLPHDGVAEHLNGFLVARTEDGKLVGCIGIERYGELGLLRSAAVDPDFQGQNIGTKLASELLKRSAEDGIAEVALLTTTAKDYFREKFGFTELPRTVYEERLSNSPEWNLPRCSSAVLMTIRLKG